MAFLATFVAFRGILIAPAAYVIEAHMSFRASNCVQAVLLIITVEQLLQTKETHSKETHAEGDKKKRINETLRGSIQATCF
jgi:hypothetical protein